MGISQQVCKVALGLMLSGATNALAVGYQEELFLCDLGIRNPDTSNSLGVNLIRFRRGERPRTLRASPVLTSAYATSPEVYDRWVQGNALTDVEFDLGADYYGSEYFLEFCYKWERTVPADRVDYSVILNLTPGSGLGYGLGSGMSNTRLGVDTTCVAKDNAGVFFTQNFKGSLQPATILGPDKVALRCIVRFSYVETNEGVRRPHSLEYDIDPIIVVKVEP